MNKIRGLTGAVSSENTGFSRGSCICLIVVAHGFSGQFMVSSKFAAADNQFKHAGGRQELNDEKDPFLAKLEDYVHKFEYNFVDRRIQLFIQHSVLIGPRQ